MEFISDIKNLMLAEMTMFLGIICLTILSFLAQNAKKRAFSIAIIFLIVAFIFCINLDTDTISLAINGSFLISKFTVFFKEIILLGTIFTILLGNNFIKQTDFGVEFYMLLLSSALGGMVLVSSRDFITMFIGFEALSIPCYILSGLIKKRPQLVTLRYLIIGAIASAIMLYGISFLYGLTGSIRFDTVFNIIKSPNIFNMAVFSGMLVISGFCFKLATIPFYNWAPDIYDNAPTSISAFLSTISKIATFGILARLICEVFSHIWVLYLAIGLIALISMTIGNILALKELKIKKLIAYSSIAHASYILAGLALGSPLSLSAMIFYLITYLFMNFTVWSAIEYLDNTTDFEIETLKSLAYKKPFIAIVLISAFASLAGLPIFVGFFSKFYLFQAMAFSGFLLYPFLLFVLINTLIALIYYLKIIKIIFEENNENNDEKTDIFGNFSPIFKDKTLKIVMIVSFIFITFGGLYSSPIIEYSQKISQSQLPPIIEYETIEGTYFDKPQKIPVSDK